MVGWQRFRVWIFGAKLTLLGLTSGKTSELCSCSALHVDVGDGKGSKFEEATLIMDISGCGGVQLEMQQGVERVRVPEGFALKGCS